MGSIDDQQLKRHAARMAKNAYGEYLSQLTA